jgi:hypothetical protein
MRELGSEAAASPGMPKLEEAGVALVPVHDAGCCLAPTFGDRYPRLVAGLGLAALMVAACLVAAIPLMPYWSIGAILGGMAIASLPFRRRGSSAIDPSELEDRNLAATYRKLLNAHDELASVLLARRDKSGLATSLLDRSRDVVIDCGRAARITNTASRYLAAHDRDLLVRDTKRLRDAAAASTDAATVEALGSAADAQARHIAALDELAAFRDRVHARLELALASVQAATAGIVKLAALDDEDMARTTAPDTSELSEHLDALASARNACWG